MRNRSTAPCGAATALTPLVLASCANPSASYQGRVSLDSILLVIDVENLNWWDMEGELDTESSQFRLGVAPSYGRARFRVSASRLRGASYLRLAANPMDTDREAVSNATGHAVITTRVIELLDHRNRHWTTGTSDTTTNLIVR